ncbi:hypothetical protein ACIBF5_25295 [Micromonospora sp. NPDC050417]|uniref:hypothetical protein n=1 Tax=Micromonospora sp. NPDC050417 TaxID=3364280 RepID=UPI0037B3F3F8
MRINATVFKIRHGRLRRLHALRDVFLADFEVFTDFYELPQGALPLRGILICSSESRASGRRFGQNLAELVVVIVQVQDFRARLHGRVRHEDPPASGAGDCVLMVIRFVTA